MSAGIYLVEEETLKYEWFPTLEDAKKRKKEIGGDRRIMNLYKLEGLLHSKIKREEREMNE